MELNLEFEQSSDIWTGSGSRFMKGKKFQRPWEGLNCETLACNSSYLTD